jgi:hypothetical protein
MDNNMPESEIIKRQADEIQRLKCALVECWDVLLHFDGEQVHETLEMIVERLHYDPMVMIEKHGDAYPE